jgi:hypothetical protein
VESRWKRFEGEAKRVTRERCNFVSIVYKLSLLVMLVPRALSNVFPSYFDMIPMLLNASVKNVAITGNILKSSKPRGAMITNANSPV